MGCDLAPLLQCTTTRGSTTGCAALLGDTGHGSRTLRLHLSGGCSTLPSCLPKLPKHIIGSTQNPMNTHDGWAHSIDEPGQERAFRCSVSLRRQDTGGQTSNPCPFPLLGRPAGQPRPRGQHWHWGGPGPALPSWGSSVCRAARPCGQQGRTRRAVRTGWAQN